MVELYICDNWNRIYRFFSFLTTTTKIFLEVSQKDSKFIFLLYLWLYFTDIKIVCFLWAKEFSSMCIYIYKYWHRKNFRLSVIIDWYRRKFCDHYNILIFLSSWKPLFFRLYIWCLKLLKNAKPSRIYFSNNDNNENFKKESKSKKNKCSE